MTPEGLLSLWLDMLQKCIDGDRKGAENMRSYFTSMYKKSSGAEQGEFHRLLAEDHRRNA